ncbi:hypothetical protein [Paenibacillus sp. MMS18-CY102]|uniref:hypothetical protein n=1 Tax=Paenibacillus sp. MMS18-CY102 TaxID=2682849 RepID=UPI001F2CB9F4|nr:hypothetical protein [Paenibacillus sp. MMS18-CY102]
MLALGVKPKGKIQLRETATVLLYHRGRRLFIMGTGGLAGLLYHASLFGTTAAVRQMLEQGESYREMTAKPS